MSVSVARSRWGRLLILTAAAVTASACSAVGGGGFSGASGTSGWAPSPNTTAVEIPGPAHARTTTIPTTTTTTTTTTTPPTTTTLPPTTAPPVTAPPTVSLEAGDTGPDVEQLQTELTRAGFYRGVIDGEFESWTEAAVVAFHKEIGAERSSVWETEDWVSVAAYQGPELPNRQAAPHRLELNLTRQLLYLVRDDLPVAVVPISTGNGASYRNLSGASVRAVTPRGEFQLRSQVDGWRVSYLGGLYRPWYFKGGYAVHGSLSVPPFPASHGCVRVPVWEADYLAEQLSLGMPIFIWDET